MEVAHGAASFEGVAPWASSVGAWGACRGEVALSHGVVGNAACVLVGEQEDAGGESNQAVPLEDHLRGVECCRDGRLGAPPEEHLEVHLKEHLEVHLEERLDVRLEEHPEVHLEASLPG